MHFPQQLNIRVSERANLNPTMEALCVYAGTFRPLPLFAGAEVPEQLEIELPEYYKMPTDLTYQTLASKKPTVTRKSTRKRKSKDIVGKPQGTVLVVDDVSDVTEMIELLLKHAGYSVATAESAREALRLAQRNHYDLVISDIGMPGMNGYELAAALRELAAYSRTPLIAVTGYSEYDDRGRAVDAGFNVHLTKPIEPMQLLTLMKELLSGSKPGTRH